MRGSLRAKRADYSEKSPNRANIRMLIRGVLNTSHNFRYKTHPSSLFEQFVSIDYKALFNKALHELFLAILK